VLDIGVMLLTLKKKEEKVENIIVICEFEDVFLELLGLPTQREIDFGIELIPGVQPISKVPYHVAPTKFLVR